MSNKRMKGTVVTRALYYGNIASPLMGKKASDSDHTHKWTVLVRGVNNEDISFWVKKVTFRLHETYPNPQRSEYTRVKDNEHDYYLLLEHTVQHFCIY